MCISYHEKISQQENELRLLWVLIIKGFEILPAQLSKSRNKLVNVTEDNDMTSGENTEIVDDQQPEWPLRASLIIQYFIFTIAVMIVILSSQWLYSKIESTMTETSYALLKDWRGCKI